MYLERLYILCLSIKSVLLYSHQKPIPASLWPDRCVRNQRILNDCNWCVCNLQQQYVCTARVCAEVDMFGHFKDTIQEHLVGMEGHGSWRTNSMACQPKMHYKREGLLCVCDENGNWPNPVCRDIFRILHEVELTNRNHPARLYKCTPKKLYLFGCNVCLCPNTGRIDPNLCTNNNCSDNDPVFRNVEAIENTNMEYDLGEIYAVCELERKYVLGCKKCVCLKNNRLICDKNCKEDINMRSDLKTEENHCSKTKPNEIFNLECNVCTCDKKGVLYCTTRKCLKDNSKPLIELSKTVDLNLRTVVPPLDGNECVPGTKYKDDCNTCFCTENATKQKVLSCTMKGCRKKRSVLTSLASDCVENTVYEVNCLICRCDAVDGVKRQSCEHNPKCSDKNMNFEPRSTDLHSLHGYCEPLHIYKKDCNTCQCLPDGKIVGCTPHICNDTEKPIIADIVPVSQRGGMKCGKDHTYRVDCNYCFCLSDGNILCTTAKCYE